MIKKKKKKSSKITDRSIRLIAERLAEGKRVRRTLPRRGRLHVDRALPFLCVYRQPTRKPDPGTQRLVTSEPSYLIATGATSYHDQVAALVKGVALPMVQEFGAFLIVEVWAGTPSHDHEAHPYIPSVPTLRVFAPRIEEKDDFLDDFCSALEKVKINRQKALVSVRRATARPSERTLPVMSSADAKELGCTVLGLEVSPIYRHPKSGEVYPLLLRELRRVLSRALRQGFYKFTRKRTTHNPRHFHMLGRRAVVRAVWEVDAGLANVGDKFDFLLQVTPVNAASAWQEFNRTGYEKAPVFHYRPLEADPIVLKRRLYDVPTERIEDPTLSFLFREKLDEIERQLTMLQDRNTKRFLYGSIQLYGEVRRKLVKVAEQLLELIPPKSRDSSRGGQLDAVAFAECAREEIEYYRRQCADVKAKVEVRSDLPAGLMVSRGSLLIGSGLKIPRSRVDALLSHEIGTHVLTYYNGRSQPFRQLYQGLAGYEALQEGLAVLSEYLVGGLSGPRLRLLAARVIAVRRLMDGASFVETYSELANEHHFAHRTAFTITMRVYRGGGLTKDAVYLKGLIDVLSFLHGGGEFEPLFVGKVATDHSNVMRELKWRGVLSEPPLRPRYLDDEGAKARLEKVRGGLSLIDMVQEAIR